jgi:hypothetical protein
MNLLLLASRLKNLAKQGASVAAHTLRGFRRTPRTCQVVTRLEEGIVAIGQRSMKHRQIDRCGVESTEARRGARSRSIYRGGVLGTTIGRRGGGGSTAGQRQIGAMIANRCSVGTEGEMGKGEGAGADKIS